MSTATRGSGRLRRLDSVRTALGSGTSVELANSAGTPLFVQEVSSGSGGASPTAVLPTTGGTIGGPAVYQPQTTATVAVWRNNASAVEACVTVVNTGDDDITLTAGGVLPITVTPGITRSRCDNIIGSSFFGLQCSGMDCEAVWRVDAMR